jgi:hypothetical protein
MAYETKIICTCLLLLAWAVRKYSLTSFFMIAEKDKCVLHSCLHFSCDTAVTLLSLHVFISEVFVSKLSL